MHRFDDEILVKCPRCTMSAKIMSGIRITCAHCSFCQTRNHPRKFATTGISFERTSNLIDWHGAVTLIPIEPARCAKCGTGLQLTRPERDANRNQTDLAEVISVTCTVCSGENGLNALWVPLHRREDIRERYFGTRLFLVQDTPKGQVWAYNRQQAMTVREFIAGGLRNVATETVASEMLENLPGWMKAAKNRKLVDQAFERLIDKFPAQAD